MTKIVVILLVTACPLAMADLIPMGDPGGGGSWEQRFLEVSKTPVDLLGVRMVSAGDAFKSPAYFDFSDASWSLALDGTAIASAWGSDLDALEWTLHFEGTLDEPLVFDYYAFVDGELVSSARCSWVDGAAATFMWVIDSGGADPTGGDDDIYTPVPAPGAALLGAVGLMCLRWVRRLSG